MLFIMAIDPLQRMFQRVTDSGLPRSIHAHNGTFRLSLYAGDAMVFANPDRDELRVIAGILGALAMQVGCY